MCRPSLGAMRQSLVNVEESGPPAAASYETDICSSAVNALYMYVCTRIRVYMSTSISARAQRAQSDVTHMNEVRHTYE